MRCKPGACPLVEGDMNSLAAAMEPQVVVPADPARSIEGGSPWVVFFLEENERKDDGLVLSLCGRTGGVDGQRRMAARPPLIILLLSAALLLLLRLVLILAVDGGRAGLEEGGSGPGWRGAARIRPARGC